MADDANTVAGALEALVRAGHDTGAASRTRLEGALSHGTTRERVVALRGLARRGELDEALWCALVADADPEVRREAREQAARRAPSAPAVRDALARGLDDDDALAVDAAAFALGEIGDASAVDPLARVAREHPDPRCRESAVAALGAIGDPRGLGAVLDALDDRPPVRRRAVVALAAFEGPEVDAALERARTDRDWQVRAAAEQLGGAPGTASD
ncbi:MAG TPA: HEAT repeat domain-containing protein [Acidimicrobiales bacterium]|nr:HEAT repeat domain-containing protein [Acidimicrobiales bacterium]